MPDMSEVFMNSYEIGKKRCKETTIIVYVLLLFNIILIVVDSRMWGTSIGLSIVTFMYIRQLKREYKKWQNTVVDAI